MVSRATFDFKQLMIRAGSPTAAIMAEMCGLNRKGVHNRINRGIGWVEADELAVRCGFLPWEVWPEWADIDPIEWLPSVCAIHGNNFVQDLDGVSEQCSACNACRDVASAA